MYGWDQVYSEEVRLQRGGEERGENGKDEDSLHTCINHENRAAEGIQPVRAEEREKPRAISTHLETDRYTHTHVFYTSVYLHQHTHLGR